MGKPRKITLAVVGIGRWGKNLVREFSKLADIRYCFHSGGRDNAQWLKENYPHIRSAASYARILNDPSVDAVVIATPVRTHFALAQKALRAGKHVFVEKPVAQTPAQVRALVREAQLRKKVLFAGYIFIYHPVLGALRRKLHRDRPVYASLEWNKYGTFGEAIGNNLLSHELSIAYQLFGEPERIRLMHARAAVTACDVLSVGLDFPSLRCDIRIDRTADFKHKSVLVVTHKNTWLWEGDSLWKLSKKNHRAVLAFSSDRTALEAECREFLHALTGKKKPVTDGAFGLKISELLAQIR